LTSKSTASTPTFHLFGQVGDLLHRRVELGIPLGKLPLDRRQLGPGDDLREMVQRLRRSVAQRLQRLQGSVDGRDEGSLQ
jgi:hypothetical protein